LDFARGNRTKGPQSQIKKKQLPLDSTKKGKKRGKIAGNGIGKAT